MDERVKQLIDRAKENLKRVKEGSRSEIKKEKLALMIDHTFLKPDARGSDIKRLLDEAIENRFWSICIPQVFVPSVAEKAKRAGVKIVTVVGFPLGYVSPQIKAEEARWSVEHGADEIDMVIHIGKAKDRKFKEIEGEIKTVVGAANGRLVKVILETALLNDEEKILAALAAEKAGADFVKTSTGFGPGGATVWDVILLKKALGKKLGIKAAGGIKSYEEAKMLIYAGATRLGTSRSIRIISEAP